MKGKKVDVTVIEVDPAFRKIVLSMGRADQYKQLKAIHLGALMWGEVRRIEEFGCFVGLDGTRISRLLHVSNISRARVESVSVSAVHTLWLYLRIQVASASLASLAAYAPACSNCEGGHSELKLGVAGMQQYT